jgi:nucleoid DNA-binding protein
MRKSELAAAIAENCALSKNKAEQIVDIIGGTIARELKK